MKIALLIISLLHLSIAMEPETYTEDYNKDDVVDTLRIYGSSGSGSSSRRALIINGKTADVDTITFFSSFNQFRAEVLIPENLRNESNAPFLQAIAKEVLPEQKEKSDPSLQWILSGLKSKVEFSDSSFFKEIIRVEPDWHKECIYPSTYRIQQDSTFLVYFGHNHFRNPKGDTLTTVFENESHRLYKTSHGVLLQDFDKGFAWMFVTDTELTGSPSKLRWQSIKKVVWDYPHSIFIHQHNPTTENDQVFTVNPQSGAVANVRIPQMHQMNLKVSIGENGIVAENDEDVRIDISFETIIAEMKKIE